jgi:hypothetical protein
LNPSKWAGQPELVAQTEESRGARHTGGDSSQNPVRAGGEGGSGGVLEHEEAVGDWFEEAEERGLTRNGVSTVAAPCRWGLVDGGSVPWSAQLTPRPENIMEPRACSGRCRPGRMEAEDGGALEQGGRPELERQQLLLWCGLEEAERERKIEWRKG